MLSISIPVWLFAIGIGLPTLTLITIVISLLRNKRKRPRTKENSNSNSHQVQNHLAQYQGDSLPGNDEFCNNSNVHQMILDLQIDAVFQSLSTVIEAEKVKLKALIGSGAYLPNPGLDLSQSVSVKESTIDQSIQSDSNEELQKESDIADQITELAAEGVTPKIIAKRLGLSLSEVVLAIRMKQNTAEDNSGGYGLSAIA